jgi:Carboxypeptidase regulatory-like domain
MRYVLVLGLTATLVAGWNVWVAWHDDGIVRGRVVLADGRPAGGAVVTFWEKTLTTLERRASTQTGADGGFVFTGQPAHHFALQAEQTGRGASPRTLYRRYFRGQNLVLPTPLRLP